MNAELLDVMGDDLAVVNAARVSFDKESDWEEVDNYYYLKSKYPNKPLSPVDDGCWSVLKEEDVKLIKYLAKHHHWSPFSHTAIKFRMKAPVPIRTQCFKHKVGFVENEESRRYISSRPELFVPEYFRSKPEGSVKQGSGDKHPGSAAWIADYSHVANDAIDVYMAMIEDGVCPEQARFILPQGVQVNWIWTGNLMSYARFYNQRTDPHAQKEVRDLAEAVGNQIERHFPVSWAALTDD